MVYELTDNMHCQVLQSNLNVYLHTAQFLKENINTGSERKLCEEILKFLSHMYPALVEILQLLNSVPQHCCCISKDK